MRVSHVSSGMAISRLRASAIVFVLMRQRMNEQRNEGETAESERMPRHRGLNLVVTKLEFHNHHLHHPAGRRNCERRIDAMMLSLLS